MACGLRGIASGIGIDPTLPRDGTDFTTLQVVMRIRVGCGSAALRRFGGIRRKKELTAEAAGYGRGVAEFFRQAPSQVH
jgi:hypothetical protein